MQNNTLEMLKAVREAFVFYAKRAKHLYDDRAPISGLETLDTLIAEQESRMDVANKMIRIAMIDCIPSQQPASALIADQEKGENSPLDEGPWATLKDIWPGGEAEVEAFKNGTWNAEDWRTPSQQQPASALVEVAA